MDCPHSIRNCFLSEISKENEQKTEIIVFYEVIIANRFQMEKLNGVYKESKEWPSTRQCAITCTIQHLHE